MLHIINRIFQMCLILALLSVGLFGLLSAMPGNPVDMLVTSNPKVKPEDIVRLKKLRGLDKPWYVQYVRWVWGYNEPYRPVEVGDVSLASSLIRESRTHGNADGERGASRIVSLKSSLRNPNMSFTFSEVQSSLEKADPELWAKLSRQSLQQKILEKKRVDWLIERISQQNPAIYEAMGNALKKEGIKQIKIRGLNDVKAEGHVLSIPASTAGYAYFVAENPQGMETVGHVKVEGSSAGPLHVEPISSRIVDDPDKFKVELKKFISLSTQGEGGRIEDSSDEGDDRWLKFSLINSPGTIDGEGIYRHKFDHPGQTAIQFRVGDGEGNEAFAAFSVEHGPIPDPTRFNNGFLHVFAGDTAALGFSNTYKRPVWDLLSGEKIICGDGREGPGETCDDKNALNGDGCSNTCQDETLGWGGIAGAKISSFFVGSGRVGNTLALMFPAILISLLLAIPIGMISAYRQYSWMDYVVNFLAFIGISLPVFWFAIMMMFLFAEQLHLFPAGGIQSPGIYDEGLWAVLSDRWYHAVLPTVVLSIAYTGRWLRYMRSSMLEVLPSDYIRTARAKGLSEAAVVVKHAFRNALIPVVTVLTLSIPALFGGAVLTETVFSWPGIGRLQYDAVLNSDYYVAIVVFLISAALVMAGNLLADLAYVLVDPRIRKA